MKPSSLISPLGIALAGTVYSAVVYNIQNRINLRQDCLTATPRQLPPSLLSSVVSGITSIVSPAASAILPAAMCLAPLGAIVKVAGPYSYLMTENCLKPLERLSAKVADVVIGSRSRLVQYLVSISVVALCINRFIQSFKSNKKNFFSQTGLPLAERVVVALQYGSLIALATAVYIPLGYVTLLACSKIGHAARARQEAIKSRLEDMCEDFKRLTKDALIKKLTNLRSKLTTESELSTFLPTTERQEIVESTDTTECFSEEEEIHIRLAEVSLKLKERDFDPLKVLKETAPAERKKLFIMYQELCEDLKLSETIQILLKNKNFKDALPEKANLPAQLISIDDLLKKNQLLTWDELFTVEFVEKGAYAFNKRESTPNLWQLFLAACTDQFKELEFDNAYNTHIGLKT